MKVIIGLVVFFLAISSALLLPLEARAYGHGAIILVLAIMVLVFYERTQEQAKEIRNLNIQLEFERNERSLENRA